MPSYTAKLRHPAWLLLNKKGELVASIREPTREQAWEKFRKAGMKGHRVVSADALASRSK